MVVNAGKAPYGSPGLHHAPAIDAGDTTSPRGPIRLVYIVSQRIRWKSLEWAAALLDRNRFDLSFLLLGNDPVPLADRLQELDVTVQRIPYHGRSATLGAARAIARYCRTHEVEILHAHYMDACLAGLFGARVSGVPVRIHTRHHAGPYPWYHRQPWGAWYDRWNNRLSTTIIAPSEQARQTLLCHDAVPATKIALVHHGFDLAAFDQGVEDAAVEALRRKHALTTDHPIVGVVARYERIKGVEFVIRAFGRLLESYPSARLVLANSSGNHAKAVRRSLSTLPAGRYTEIPFEEQMPALYKTFDVFVHAPIRPHLEGFGQVYIEAMAAGVPCVCTIAGIAGEFVADGENAIVVPAKDSEQIHVGLIRILGDAALRHRLTAEARRQVEKRFGINRMIHALEQLYLTLHRARGSLLE